LETQAASPEPAGGKPRTLALIGDRYHSYDYIRTGLDRIFKEIGLPVRYTTNCSDLSPSLLKPYQLFICFRDNMIWPSGYLGPDQWTDAGFLENPEEFPSAKPENWITEEQGEAVKDFVAAGNGFYSLHCNALVSNSSKNYRDVQGGGVLYHPNPQPATSYPALRPFKVHVANKEHPVTQGVEDFIVTDEQYFTIYDKDPKNILLHGENLDGLTFAPDYREFGGRSQRGPENQAAGGGALHTLGTVSTSGWAHEYGTGRVVFTALGGTIHSMWQPEHLKMQKNAVRWLLKMT